MTRLTTQDIIPVVPFPIGQQLDDSSLGQINFGEKVFDRLGQLATAGIVVQSQHNRSAIGHLPCGRRYQLSLQGTELARRAYKAATFRSEEGRDAEGVDRRLADD